jgi:hypothetical protein
MSQLKDAVAKLDQIAEDISEMKVTQAKQAKDLEYHILRTDLAEERLDLLQEQLEPLKTFKNRLEGGFKVVGMVASGLGLLFGFIKVLAALF